MAASTHPLRDQLLERARSELVPGQPPVRYVPCIQEGGLDNFRAEVFEGYSRCDALIGLLDYLEELAGNAYQDLFDLYYDPERRGSRSPATDSFTWVFSDEDGNYGAGSNGTRFGVRLVAIPETPEVWPSRAKSFVKAASTP